MIGRWQAWYQRTVNRRIFAAMLTVGVLSVAVRAAGFFKELVVARQFGTGDPLDAFLIAFLLPSFTANVIAGALSPAFIPAYVQVRRTESEPAAQVFFSEVLGACLAAFLAVTVLLAAGGRFLLPLLASSFGPAKMDLTLSLFLRLLPAFLLSGLAFLGTAALNARQRFGLAALAPILVPLGILAALLAAGRSPGVQAIVAGTLGGLVLQVFAVAWGARRLGFPLRPRFRGWTPGLRQFALQYLPMVAGLLLTGGADLVDQSMAAMLGPGSVATLSYGSRIVSATVGLASTALSTAVLPHFADMVSRADWTGLRHTLRTYTRLILAFTVPVVLGLGLLSGPIVRLVFERGAFTARDTLAVARVQSLFALQIPFYAFGILGVRLLSALGRNQTLMWISLVNLAVNVAGNYLLMRRLGVAGIALSTSMVYLLSAGLIGLAVVREIGRREAAARSL